MNPIAIGFAIGFAMLITHWAALALGMNIGFKAAVDYCNFRLQQHYLNQLTADKPEEEKKPVDPSVN